MVNSSVLFILQILQLFKFKIKTEDFNVNLISVFQLQKHLNSNHLVVNELQY